MPRRSKPLRAFSASQTAMPLPRSLLAHLRKVERHYVRLFERAPELSGRAAEFVVRGRRRETMPRRSTAWRMMGFRQPHEVADAVRRWHAGLYRALRGEQAREQPHRTGAGHHRPIRARRKPGCGFRSLRPVPQRTPRRRPISFAAAAKSGTDPLCRADPRRRAAACRYSGAKSAYHRSAGRSEFLRRAAGREQARDGAGAQRSTRRARLRGRARCDPPVRPGAHVSDRCPHPVRFGIGGAGRRSFSRALPMYCCAPCIARCGGRFCRSPWPHPRRRERHRRARSARRARDDGKLRSRSHRDL